MMPDDQPTIVSLEQHRRRRQAEARKKQQQRAAATARRPAALPANKAINWRRVPALLAALALFMLFMWGVRQIGGLLDPFH